MKSSYRDNLLEQLETTEFDVVVIGGGISGAWIAFYCSQAGLKTALVERGDFAGETSSASSKLLHGGIRYLQQLQFGKVRESTIERARYLHAAPHLANPIPFVVPTFKGLKRGRFLLNCGLAAYGLLGTGQHAISDLRRRCTMRPQNLTVEQLNAICQVSHLEHTGAVSFPEFHMYDSERTVWAVLESAIHAGASVANYTTALNLETEDNAIAGLMVRSAQPNKQFRIRCQFVINAAGPWVDRLQPGGASEDKASRLPPVIQNFAAGAHIITRQISGEHAIAVNTKQKSSTTIDRGGRHFFIIPWRGFSLIGTSYRETTDPDNTNQLRPEDLNQLLEAVNESLPDAQLSAEDIVSAYVGLYPLRTNSIKQSTYQGSGEYVIIDHQTSDNIKGLITALGAKYTTGRILAEKTLRLLADKADRRTLANKALFDTRLHSACYEDLETFTQDQHEQLANRFTAAQINHLVTSYGSRLPAFIRFIDEHPEKPHLETSIVAGQPDILGQIAWAVEHELAITLDDALLRRTSVGLLGISEAGIDAVANLMKEMLGWSADHTQAQINQTLQRMQTFRSIIDDYYRHKGRE